MNLSERNCAPNVEKASAADVAEYLAQIQDWQENDGKIEKAFKFDDFVAAIAFVNKLADAAEAECHHPDIAIHYNQVQITIWTHSVGGLSVNDFILAAKIDQI